MHSSRSADVLVYDFLCQSEMLAWARPGVEIIYAGKSGSSHTLTQDEINALLVARAEAGKTVVRLKGGDPYVFGRGGEEAQVLVRAGIPFEVVPGVYLRDCRALVRGHSGDASRCGLDSDFCHGP